MDFTRKLIKDKHFVLTLIRNGANDRQLEKHIRPLTDEAHKLAIGYTATSVYARSDAKIFRDFRQAIEWLGVANLENKINELRQE